MAKGQVKDEPKKGDAVLVELPVAEAPANEYYRTRMVSIAIIQKMTPQQKQGLSRLFNGLVNEHAVMASGKPVHTAVDAIKYLLERVAEAT